MNIFTNDQKSRMIATINTKRPNLLNQTICSVPTDIQEENVFKKKELVKVIDLLGRIVLDHTRNVPLLYIYKDGSVEKKMVVPE